MPTMIIRNPDNIKALAARLEGRKLPLTVSWAQGASRSNMQNRLAQRWFADIARQVGDMTHSEVRADCKVTFGVPIMAEENDAFRQTWAETFGALNYQAMRKAVEVLEPPVTRLMNVKQMSEFMDAIQRHYGGAGMFLTDPESLKYEEEFV